jgi:hypothetical protein
MVIDKEDLWPDNFGSLDVETPLQILRKQASFVGTKTGNILEGSVTKTVDEDGDFVLHFYLVAPALDNYRYKLLTVWHGIGLYPVITSEVSPQVRCENAEEFKEYLRSRFGSEETMKIIRALIAQSRSE